MSVLRIDDTMLMAFADNQLDPDTAAQIREAIAASPDMQLRVDLFRQTARAVRTIHAEPSALELPPRLRRSVHNTLVRERTRHVMRVGLPVAAAIGGLLLGAWVTLSVVDPSNAQSVNYMLGEVAEYHAVYAAETDHLVEVPATQTAEIESWLGGRLGLPLRVPDLESKGLQFKGARLLVVEGEPVAQLMYETADAGRIALCVGRTGLGDGTAGRVDRDGTIVSGVASGRYLYIAAGSSSEAALVDQLTPALPALLAS